VIAWTANDPALVGRLVAEGVDAIVSDDPRMVFETLATLDPP
jgi:glycerophosphoryl diester phosphodiesterase